MAPRRHPVTTIVAFLANNATIVSPKIIECCVCTANSQIFTREHAPPHASRSEKQWSVSHFHILDPTCPRMKCFGRPCIKDVLTFLPQKGVLDTFGIHNWCPNWSKLVHLPLGTTKPNHPWYMNIQNISFLGVQVLWVFWTPILDAQVFWTPNNEMFWMPIYQGWFYFIAPKKVWTNLDQFGHQLWMPKHLFGEGKSKHPWHMGVQNTSLDLNWCCVLARLSKTPFLGLLSKKTPVFGLLGQTALDTWASKTPIWT